MGHVQVEYWRFPFLLFVWSRATPVINAKFLPPAADDLSTLVFDHRKSIVVVVELAQNFGDRENIQRSQREMKDYYDRNASQLIFEIGQRVWVYTPRTIKRLSPWSV